jgi:hypothetical protein
MIRWMFGRKRLRDPFGPPLSETSVASGFQPTTTNPSLLTDAVSNRDRRMYYYISFLRNPPKTASLSDQVSFSPQVANDLRTECISPSFSSSASNSGPNRS